MSHDVSKTTLMGCLVILVLAVLAFLPFILDAETSFTIYFLYLTFIYIAMAQGWNLVAGYAGQASLGQHAFFGLGAYVTAICWRDGLTGYLDPLAMMLSGAVAVLLAIVVGLPLLAKLKGDYFALGTLGLGEVLRVVFIQGGKMTGGPVGIMLPSISYQSMRPYYLIALGVATVALLVIYILIHSRIGLGLVAIREDEQAAEANGIPVLRMKILAFAVGAFFTGESGSLTAYYSFHVPPGGVFTLTRGLLPRLMTILGGIGTFWGPVIGALILSGVFELANIWMPELHPLISGLFIVLITIFMPNGVVSLVKKQGGPPLLRRWIPFGSAAAK
jgi:branched-chain amino acid transport system permease protein